MKDATEDSHTPSPTAIRATAEHDLDADDYRVVTRRQLGEVLDVSENVAGNLLKIALEMRWAAEAGAEVIPGSRRRGQHLASIPNDLGARFQRLLRPLLPAQAPPAIAPEIFNVLEKALDYWISHDPEATRHINAGKTVAARQVIEAARQLAALRAVDPYE